MSAQRYENPETKQKLDEARRKLQRQEEAEKVQKAEDIATARNEIASEEQPDGELPDLRVTETVEFRGHEFEFSELGDSELEASKFSDIDDGDIERGTEAAEFVYKTLGQSGVNTDEAYWRQYSIQAGDTDGVLDLFTNVIEAFNDADPEALEQAGN